MSLSRLWQQQSKKKPARKLLADMYGWFTEGFDTADLHEAKALLEALARPSTSKIGHQHATHRVSDVQVA